MIAGGLAAGICASVAGSKLIAGFLFGVSATDPAASAILPVFLALVAVAASDIPARRASKVDPVSALRSE
jgi:putative ABC transport system permease protein